MSGGTELATVLAALRQLRGLDLRDYRKAPLQKGLEARLAATGAGSHAVYVDRIMRDADEASALIDALLINVTEFFRDAEVFHAIATAVAPALRHGQATPVRAWDIGCSTGQEAWSLAMALDSAASPPQVLATDIDEAALEVARRARYPAGSVQAQPHIATGQVAADAGGVLVQPRLRERVILAVHDITGPRLAPRESVIADFDLVMIRNVLIYFNRSLQGRTFERLVQVVRPGGALVLGPTEEVPASLRHVFHRWPGTDPRLHIYCSARKGL